MFGLFKKREIEAPMWLFVGLGNPGKEYQNNRHNVGFMSIHAMADGETFFANDFRAKFQGWYAEPKIAGQKVGFLMPNTYMNLSGESVGAAAKFYKVPPDRVIVFHDELDLKPGEVRIKKGGGNAGHNGLKSISAHLGTPDFWRVRIGIGHPGNKDQVSDYVLSDFAKAEQKGWVSGVLEALAEYYTAIVTDGPKAYEQKVCDHVAAYLKKMET